MTISRTILSLPALAFIAAFAAPSVARAEGEEVAQCAGKWLEAIQNPKFYQPWGDYFTECKKTLAEGAAAKPEEAKPAAEAPPPVAEPKKAEAPKPAPAAPAPAPAAAHAATPAPVAAPAPTPAKPATKPVKKHPAHRP